MDICFKPEYGKLYEKQEGGELQTFEFKSQYGKVQNMFIKREIPDVINGTRYYDITTPYGYGGPVVKEATNTNIGKLMQEYSQAFERYCQKERIVSEFVRFHLFDNQNVREHFDGELSLIGPHVIRDLKEPLEENMSKSVKKGFRKAVEKGLEVRFDTTGEYLKDFLAVYYATMERNNAKGFYYFDSSFFEKLHHSLKGQFVYIFVLLDGKVIATELTLLGQQYAYGLLGGTLSEYFDYEPALFLKVQLMNRLKEQGYDYFIMGGGYRKNDGIYKFKKKFAKNGDCPFYIGKKIHNLPIYEELLSRRRESEDFEADTKFFPAYRFEKMLEKTS